MSLHFTYDQNFIHRKCLRNQGCSISIHCLLRSSPARSICTSYPSCEVISCMVIKARQHIFCSYLALYALLWMLETRPYSQMSPATGGAHCMALYIFIHLYHPLALLHSPGMGDKGLRPTASRTMAGLLKAVRQNSQYPHHSNLKALLCAQTASPRVAAQH